MALTALFRNKEEDSARSQAWKNIKKNYRSGLTWLTSMSSSPPLKTRTSTAQASKEKMAGYAPDNGRPRFDGTRRFRMLDI